MRDAMIGDNIGGMFKLMIFMVIMASIYNTVQANRRGVHLRRHQKQEHQIMTATLNPQLFNDSDVDEMAVITVMQAGKGGRMAIPIVQKPTAQPISDIMQSQQNNKALGRAVFTAKKSNTSNLTTTNFGRGLFSVDVGEKKIDKHGRTAVGASGGGLNLNISYQNSNKPPVRVWGDECIPPLDEDEEDECTRYTDWAYGYKANAKKLSCDEQDKLCLCSEDANGNRAEFSKELEICLVPRFYRCNSSNECAPLLVCEKATKRDYEMDPDIPSGFPKICRLKLVVPNQGRMLLSDFGVFSIRGAFLSLFFYFLVQGIK